MKTGNVEQSLLSKETVQKHAETKHRTKISTMPPPRTPYTLNKKVRAEPELVLQLKHFYPS